MRKFTVVKNIENISRFIECISIIKCSRCGTMETIALDADEAADEFVITGQWAATTKNAYCPKCAKKHLTKK